MSRKALGRGLSALIRDVEETKTAGLEQVAVHRIEPNPLQPRRHFPEESLKELADSIRSTGIVQPVLLRPAPGIADRFHLIAGERRWRAARLAGLEALPAIVRDLSDREALELALTENLLREDLNPMEVARAYDVLQRQFGLSHSEIAERLGASRSAVTNTLRLLRLPPEIQGMLENKELSEGHARSLLAVESPEAQIKLARRIARDGLSVRHVEGMIANRGLNKSPRTASGASNLDPNIRSAILEMERALGTRVKIVGDPKRGKIEVSYFSEEDLNRIYEFIVRR
jgi:ParB family chromosome partitioning protein